MLCEFRVKNFKNFKEWFSFDLTETKNYDFNKECVDDGVVSKVMIYGPNACGKSNLGHAIFDLTTHLTDKKINQDIYSNYLNAESNNKLAEFAFTFKFDGIILEYKYGKENVNKLVYETLSIDGIIVASLDKRKNEKAIVNLNGAETLNLDLYNSNISIVKYVKNNTILKKNAINKTFSTFVLYCDFILKLNATIKPDYLPEKFMESEDNIKGLETYLNEKNIKCSLKLINTLDGKKKLYFDYGAKQLDFFETCSTGTGALVYLYTFLYTIKLYKQNHTAFNEINNNFKPLVYIDEYDAFYHHALSKKVIKEFKKIDSQIILTTHNTTIMSNYFLRPDCYFLMNNENIKAMHTLTNKELRKAHNIEKMYKAGAFNE